MSASPSTRRWSCPSWPSGYRKRLRTTYWIVHCRTPSPTLVEMHPVRYSGCLKLGMHRVLSLITVSFLVVACGGSDFTASSIDEAGFGIPDGPAPAVDAAPEV